MYQFVTFADSQSPRFADSQIATSSRLYNLRICECKTLQICESTNLHEFQSSFIFQTPMTERLCHTGTHNESAHAHIQGVRTQPLRGSNTSTRFVTLLFPAMDADSIHFAQAKEATEQMVLRELHEHVCVGPMPSGAINITNLPIRELLIRNMNVLY